MSLEQGWELKPGDVVPLKVKLPHMEKAIVGLPLATAANKARLDSTTTTAKECIAMSTVLVMHITPYGKWLTIEYLRTNGVALLF